MGTPQMVGRIVNVDPFGGLLDLKGLGDLPPPRMMFGDSYLQRGAINNLFGPFRFGEIVCGALVGSSDRLGKQLGRP